MCASHVHGKLSLSRSLALAPSIFAIDRLTHHVELHEGGSLLPERIHNRIHPIRQLIRVLEEDELRAVDAIERLDREDRLQEGWANGSEHGGNSENDRKDRK